MWRWCLSASTYIRCFLTSIRRFPAMPFLAKGFSKVSVTDFTSESFLFFFRPNCERHVLHVKNIGWCRILSFFPTINPVRKQIDGIHRFCRSGTGLHLFKKSPPFWKYAIGSMYGIFTYRPNVGKYTIHGSYGYSNFHFELCPFCAYTGRAKVMLVESSYCKPFLPRILLSTWFWSDFPPGIPS